MNSGVYRLSPSLLDSFAWFLRSDRDSAEQEMIDSLNSVFIENDAILTGVALEDAVCLAANTSKAPKSPVIHNTPCSSDIIIDIAQRIRGGVFQVEVQGAFDTSLGKVHMKGYIDVLNRDLVQDIKYTAKYKTGKYKDKYQKDVYPVLLDMQGVKTRAMQYVISDLKDVYVEEYPVNVSESRDRIEHQCEALICFMEKHRDRINDNRFRAKMIPE